METWFIFVLVSIFAIAAGEIGQKISVSTKDNLSAATVNFLVATVQTAISVLFLIVFNIDFEPNLDSSVLLRLIVSSILGFFFFKLLYTSYKGNSASLSQVIFSMSAIISTVLGIIFFDESKSPIKFLGIAVILLAVVIALFKKGEKFSKYNLFALASAVIYAVLTNIDKAQVTEINPHYYQALSAGIFLIASLVFSGRVIVKELRQYDLIPVKSILLSAVAFTISNKFTYLAYSNNGEVGKVDAINTFSILLIIILEILILKDIKDLKKKFFSAGLALVGVLILGFVK